MVQLLVVFLVDFLVQMVHALCRQLVFSFLSLPRVLSSTRLVLQVRFAALL